MIQNTAQFSFHYVAIVNCKLKQSSCIDDTDFTKSGTDLQKTKELEKSHLGQKFYFEAFWSGPKIGNFLAFSTISDGEVNILDSKTWSICISVNAFWFQQNGNALFDLSAVISPLDLMHTLGFQSPWYYRSQ